MKNLVSLGTFDGVHLGHQRLIAKQLALARRVKLAAKIVIFDKPPRFFFQPQQAGPLLTLPKEREELIRSLGVPSVETLRFNARIAGTPHEAFFERYFLGLWKAGGIYVGPDFAFGKRRAGTIDWLCQACRKRGLRLSVQPLARWKGEKISSSRIRELVAAGAVEAAARCLGRPHFASGKVVHGDGLGRTIGIPTANVAVPDQKLLPSGVFKVRVLGAPGPRAGRIGVCNVGVRPTVSGRGLRTEVHIPDFSGSLYGKTLKLEFLSLIRSERKFANLKALTEQIHLDIAQALRQ